MFPPLGGAGVQRSLKYVKYLPQFSWKPFVLTVKRISYYVYDESLLAEVPPEANVIRTESLDPLRLGAFIFRGGEAGTFSKATEKAAHNRFLSQGSPAVQAYRRLRDFLAFPDAQLGWIPFAYRNALKTIAKHKIDVIVAHIGTLSSGVVAYMLSGKTDTPYLLDFSDGWTSDPYLARPTLLHKWGHEVLEKRIVGDANAITVYGEFLSRRFVERYPWLDGRIHVLLNGYDPEDFSDIIPKDRSPEAFRIVYMGSLYAHHETNLRVFVEALKSMPEELRRTLEVVFVGQVYTGAVEQVAAAELDVKIRFTGYVRHAEALSHLASADAGLLFVKPGDLSMVTGKVFEYVAMGIPILACVEPEGACAGVLRQAGRAHWITPPDDSKRLASTIVRLAEEGWPRPERSDVEQFNRRRNTERLAAILDQLVENQAKGRSRGNIGNHD